MACEPGEAPVSETLATISEELRHLAAMGERLQDALSPMLRTACAAAGKEMQALDLLVQHAGALAAFTERCGHAAPPAWRLDAAAAAQGLTLSDLAARLSGAPERGGSPPSPAHARASGDVELW